MKVCSECRRCFDDDVELCYETHGSLSDSRAGSVSMIAGYRIDERLYSGLRGDLFRATRTDCGRSCLIRIVDADAETAPIFLKEAKLVSDLYHPNLTAVYETGTTSGGEPYVVCEDVDDYETLRFRLGRLGPPDLLESIHIARTAAETLHELHQSGVVHRALNPDNILVSTDAAGETRVRLQNLDFGGAGQSAIISNKFLIDTETAAIKYFAPEQCSGEPATPRTDVYSLGILLYELIAGAPPFVGAQASAVIEQHRHSRPPELTIANFDLRMLISHTLMESLSKRGDLRQASADLFARQLKHIELLATHVSTPPPAVNVVTPHVSEARLPRMIAVSETDVDLPDLQDTVDRIEEAYASPAQTATASITADASPSESDLKDVDPANIKQIDFRAVREQMHDILAATPTPLTLEKQQEPKMIRWEEPLDDIPSVEETLEHLRADGAEGAFDADLAVGSFINSGGVSKPDHDEPLQGRNAHQTASGAVIELGTADAAPTTAAARVQRIPPASVPDNGQSIFSSIEGLSAVRFSRLRRGVGVGAAVCVLALAFAFRSDIVDAFTPFDLDKTDPSRLRMTAASGPVTAQKQVAEVSTKVEEEFSEPQGPMTADPPPVEITAASLPPNTAVERPIVRRDQRPAPTRASSKPTSLKTGPAPITPSTIVITYADPKKRKVAERDPFERPKSAAGMTRPRIVANPKP